MTKCQIHGLSGFFESCEHVRNLIATKQSNKVVEIETCPYTMRVCDDCIDKYDLKKYIIPDDHDYNIFKEEDHPDEYWENIDKAYDKMKTEGWCSKCYETLKENNKA